MAAIDYGALIWKNGVRYKPNELYPNIDELGIYPYKYWLIDMKTEKIKVWLPYEHMSYHTDVDDVHYDIREVVPSVHKATIRYGDDRYVVIYGYGIDNKQSTWNRVKNIYLGKADVKRVDRIINRYGWQND